MAEPDSLLMIAASEQDADMLYAVGMFVPDPFIFLRIRGRDSIVMSDLEIDRARRQAPHCRVLSLSRCQERLRQQGVRKPGLTDVAADLLRQRRVRRVVVPRNFPCGLASELEDCGIRVRPGNLFPEREQKSADEIKKISAALAMAEVGMAEAMRILRAAKISSKRQLMHRGVPLTSEKLRAAIDTAIIQAGGLASHTIVAGGEQACDPHEPGHGPLRAHEPIILDIFPRSQATGYFGDITRTVVRGRANEAVKGLYAMVLQSQAIAFRMLRPGVRTAEVHRAVEQFFEQKGYKTGKQSGRMQGFFHGTGHGLGLEIHEAPRLARNSDGTLKAGHVVTVEPGLYYPGIGGVRLEDVAWVRAQRPWNLTGFEKVLEI